jgi:hypothetical protein
MARAANAWGSAWACRFHILGLAAATMLWINHAAALCAVGSSRREFYREIRRELRRFIRLLRQESASQAIATQRILCADFLP